MPFWKIGFNVFFLKKVIKRTCINNDPDTLLTVKMHMLTTHVVDFIVDSASTPAVFGEQESESFYRISKHQFDTESNLQDKALEYSVNHLNACHMSFRE